MAETEADKDAASVSVQGATTPPREKPVIEAEALRLAGEEKPGDTSAEEAPDLGAMGLAAPEPRTHDSENLSAPRVIGQPPTPRRRTKLHAFALAIVLGALIAVGGAFAL